MKILETKQIRETDAFTIRHESIKSIELMERAAKAFVARFIKFFDEDKKVLIVSGSGNNGGDAMAIGRLLIDLRYEVSAYVVRNERDGSEDFQINYERLCRDIDVKDINKTEDIPEFEGYDVIVDGIFGSGLSRAVSGLHAEVISVLNHANTPIVSIDIASGLFSDTTSTENSVIQANMTFSFQLPKLAFLMPENDRYVGDWDVVDIGLDEDFIHRQATQHFFITKEFIKPFIPDRKKHSHKGTYGKGLIITGSFGKMGASVLSARAFMRSGAGLLTVLSPQCGYQVLQTSVPEAMVASCGVDVIDDIVPDLDKYDAIGIGPGIGVERPTVDAFTKLLQNTSAPLVIDADGLNILAKNRHLLEMIPEHSILTPHVGEFERLMGESVNDFTRISKLRDFAKKVKSYVVLKGAHTAVATPENAIYFNSTGNPGMATGGSGDVLTGIITSLLAQHQSPFHAAVLGVYLHGLAGDSAKEVVGEDALIASDIIDYLPRAFRELKGL